MEVKLLERGYKNNDTFYRDFLNNSIMDKEEYFSGDVVYIKEAPDFPVYMGKGREEAKKQDFLKAFHTVSQSYIQMERDLILDETFWHSLLVTKKRDYLLDMYPQIENGVSVFNNVVLKKFDWENYIYKIILGAQYIYDNINVEEARQKYYELIIDNLDLYNYIIKYEIFRNEKFLLNILSIIDELNLSKILKAKIKGREDLGDDERVGRRVIFEFNKSYPVIMSPMLEKEDLKSMFVEYLSYYYEPNNSEGKITDDDGARKQRELVTIGAKRETVKEKANIFHENSVVTSPEITEATTLEKENRYQEDKVLVYLKKFQLEYVDHRNKGGSLWVIGDKNIGVYLKPLESEGVRFTYKPVGGKASKNKPAWFWYGK